MGNSMEENPDKPGLERQKVIVKERSLLVAHGKSQKLTALSNKVQPRLRIEDSPLPDKVPAGLRPEVAAELAQARKLINDRIDEILHSFPPARKNKFFSFRFGSVEAIKTLTVKAAFKVLGIEDSRVKMRLIAELNYYGGRKNNV
jgi:hypothetical protein